MASATLQVQLPLTKFPFPSYSSSFLHNHKSAIRLFKSRFSSNSSCRASNSSRNSAVTEFDLYDLLGIDRFSNQSQIKLAYRALQKRCHPDIAGPTGHDMAIILNEAYAVLSDPSSRMAYDKEQAKIEDLRGYTGKPIYSAWCGSETEERAVFVDEVKCVGCLKCALLAEKTFAIESVYGRARVVAQWADPEHNIQEAIDACPIDCISIVERSNLAALEFLMSKQPRGSVRIGAGNTVGTRVSNIFADLEKFQSRYQDAKEKSCKEHSGAWDAREEARISAFQAIRAISNLLYWRIPGSGAVKKANKWLAPITQKSSDPNLDKLRDAVAARKRARDTVQPIQKISSIYMQNEEYWIRSNLALPEANKTTTASKKVQRPAKRMKELDGVEFSGQKKIERNRFLQAFPIGTATLASIIVRLQLGDTVPGRLKEHIGGSLLLDIVNSSWLEVILAGITWYLIGMYVAELIEVAQSKLEAPRK